MDGGLCVPNTKAEGPLAGSRWGFLKQRDILHGRWEHGEGTPPSPRVFRAASFACGSHGGDRAPSGCRLWRAYGVPGSPSGTSVSGLP